MYSNMISQSQAGHGPVKVQHLFVCLFVCLFDFHNHYVADDRYVESAHEWCTMWVSWRES